MSYLNKIILSLSLSLLAVVSFGLLSPKAKLSIFDDDKFWIDKVFTKKRYNVVVGGDSRVYRGVNPQKLAEGLGDTTLSILNFGFSSCGFSQEMLDEMGKKIDATQKRKIIVLGLSPYALTPQACKNWQIHYLKKQSQTDVFLTSKVIPTYLSIFEPITITKLCKSIANLTPTSFDKVHDNGWKSSHSYSEEPTLALELYKKQFVRNPINFKALDTLQIQIQKWTKVGIKVFAYRPPTTKEMEALENTAGGFDEALTRKKIETAGGVWIDFPDRFGYKSYDGSHLPAEEANRFSFDLGKMMSIKH